MKLKSSPKIYQNYKCDFPKKTIKKIEEGFKKLGLEISYKEKEVKNEGTIIYISHALIDSLGICQYGKGDTKDLAKASAYAETTERFSTGTAEIRIPFSKKPEGYWNLFKDINNKNYLKGQIRDKNHSFIDIKRFGEYFQGNVTKEKFESFLKLGLLDIFVDAYSITKREYEKIPINLIEIFSNTNGLASGNTIEEAIAQASFEIFERYASNEIVHKKIMCPTIDPQSIKDEKVKKCIKMLEASNIEAIIKDFTFDNCIPVVGVLFIDHNLKDDKNKLRARDYKRINVGAHINLNEAIKRCFNENLQVIELDKQKYDLIYDIWTKKLEKEYIGMDDEFRYYVRDYHYYGDLSFLEKGEKIDFSSLNSYEYNDSLKDVEEIKKICEKNKWNFSLVDYTHKVLKFPTVRIIIPPISTDFDSFVNKTLEIKGLEEQFNYFYGIKDFYKYLKNDDWITNEKQIKNLISNLEKYLSQELDHYYFYINRENNFSQLINVFHILPFLYLATNDFKEAKKYFEALIDLDFHPPIDSTFYKSLYQTKYNPDIYQEYIDKIDKALNEGEEFKFRLESNPFNPETSSDEKYFILLKNINKSFI